MRIPNIEFNIKKAVALCSLLYAVLMIVAVPTANADTTYTYTGPAFNLCDNISCPPFTKVSGSFTVTSPLADNLNVSAVTPNSYDFTNGVTDFNNTNSSIHAFSFSTSGSGDIIAWFINFQIAGSPPLTLNTNFNNVAGKGDDFTEGYPCSDPTCPDGGTGGIAEVQSTTGGTWASSGGGGGTPAPEPGSLVMLGSAMASVPFVRRLKGRK